MSADTPCPCTNLVAIPGKITRAVGFTPSLDLVQDAPEDWGRLDVIFSSLPPSTSRLWRAQVVCACEPGWTRIGGSTVVIYGRNRAELLHHYDAATKAPITLIALVPGARLYGGVAERLREAITAEGRIARIISFAERPVVRIDPLTSPTLISITESIAPTPDPAAPQGEE